ncbi:hypothetical protein AN219_35080, partial [Streptomyces nanshensis]
MTTTAAPGGRPLEAARARLQRHLDERHARCHDGPGALRRGRRTGTAQGEGAASEPSTPLVVPLGAHDVLGEGSGDPYSDVRPRARVQLTSQAVLVGPWGGDAGTPVCGRCLGMRWQRLRTRTERDALET